MTAKIFRDLVSFREAKALLTDNVHEITETECVKTENSLGRIVSNDVRSRISLPPFNRSEVDGYAVASTDLEKATLDHQVALVLGGSVEIGNPAIKHPGHGFCLYIATGAVIPLGSDAVVMVEDVCLEGNTVKFSKSVTIGENIAYAGEDMDEATMILPRNSVIDTVSASVMEASGISSVNVYRKVRIGIAASGNELLMPESTLSDGKLYESNSLFVSMALSRLENVTIKRYEPMRDDIGEIRKAIGKMLSENDAIVLSGGTSAGEGDFVYRVLEAETPGIVFHGVAVKPGTPTVFALSGNKPVFGLPGFPVSAMMIFSTLFMPAIEKMSMEVSGYRTIKVKMGIKTLVRIGYSNLVIMRIAKRHDEYYGYPVTGASGSISRLLDAEGFAIIEGDRKYVDAGDEVDAYLLKDSIPESIFLGTPDRISEIFISSLENKPAVVKINDEAVVGYISDVKPDFALISCYEENHSDNFKGYLPAASYDVPYGIYVQNETVFESVRKSIFSGKISRIALLDGDSSLKRFNEYIADNGLDYGQISAKFKFLPTSKACLISVVSGENDAYIGRMVKFDSSTIKFYPLGKVRCSILVSSALAERVDLSMPISKLMEAIPGIDA